MPNNETYQSNLPLFEDPREDIAKEFPQLENLEIDKKSALELLSQDELEFLKKGVVTLEKPALYFSSFADPHRIDIAPMHMERLVPLVQTIAQLGTDVREEAVLATYQRYLPSKNPNWTLSRIYNLAIRLELTTLLYENGIKANVTSGRRQSEGIWNTERIRRDGILTYGIPFPDDKPYDIELEIVEAPIRNNDLDLTFDHMECEIRLVKNTKIS